MNRRHVLALLGSAAVGGCLGSESGDPTTQTATPTTSAARTTPEPDTTSESDTTTQTAVEPPEVGEPLPSDCPVYDEDAERAVCNPGASAALAMERYTPSITLPKGSLTFAVENGTDATFQFNPHAWRLHKRVDGDWYYVAPGLWPEPLYGLPPGETHEWSVSVDNTDLGSEIVGGAPKEDLRLRGLGGGTYAFGVSGSFQGGSQRTALVTRFEADGDPLSLSPTDSVRSVERDGETVVMRMPDTQDPRRVTVTKVADSSAAAERVITEQVLRTAPLRNALATFEDGVKTVRVVNAESVANYSIRLEGRRYVEYGGVTYRIETKRLGTTTER